MLFTNLLDPVDHFQLYSKLYDFHIFPICSATNLGYSNDICLDSVKFTSALLKGNNSKVFLITTEKQITGAFLFVCLFL